MTQALPLPNLRRLHEWTLASGDRIAVEAFDLAWDRILTPRISGSVLHVGSKASILDAAAPWRAVLPGSRVIGMDLSAGDNVDVVCDIQAPVQEIRRRCSVRSFDAVICAHVLEHLPRPWEAARNLQYLLRPGGTLLVTVPWVQGYHEFPEDYWRMSFAGLRALLPDIEPELEFYSGASEEQGYRLLWNGVPEHSTRTCRIERNLFQIELAAPPDQAIFDDRPGATKLAASRLYLPACSVNLLGRKKG
jgi:SAM-dependent methyltransferase